MTAVLPAAFAASTSAAVKAWVMNAKNVVGVGNIYASEALFLAGIRPTARANRIAKYRFGKLIERIKQVIADAIDSGGTTLQDYRNAEGEAGSFQRRLQVYGRQSEPCYVCGTHIRSVVLSQRSTFFCPTCQLSVPTTKFFTVEIVHRAGLTGLDHIYADVRGRS